ncbi:MAG TPA: anti-sigma factor [Candidatus Limnocylindria bacterium]|nr:anti-sigma factor [Candidatus Limnocylindria bacterium]
MSVRHDEIREQLEAYALGSLDPLECARVEHHLKDCAECQRVVSDYGRLIDRFPDVLARRSRSRLDPATKPRLLRAVATRRRVPLLALAGIAASLALAISLAWNLQLSRAVDAERNAFIALGSYQEIVFEVVDSPQVHRVLLKPPVTGSTSYGKVYVRPDLPFVVAMVGRLPDAPNGNAYHVWLTYASGETVLAGTLAPKPNTQGFDALVFDAGRNGPVLASVKVILQPTGSRQPEGAPALIWNQ